MKFANFTGDIYFTGEVHRDNSGFSGLICIYPPVRASKERLLRSERALGVRVAITLFFSITPLVSRTGSSSLVLRVTRFLGLFAGRAASYESDFLANEELLQEARVSIGFRIA